MDNQKEYQAKLRAPEEAVQVVKSGDWIDYGWCTCAPEALDRALAARYQELYDVKVRGAVLMSRPAILSVPDTAEHFIWNSWHMGGLERRLIDEGIAYYIPLRYSELPRYYRENVDPIHVAMVQAAPMDGDGYFSYGLNASHLQALFEKAEVVVLEVNPNYPRCPGGEDAKIHISQVDMVVEGRPHEPDARRRPLRGRPRGGQPDRGPDSRRGLPPAGHWRDAQRRRLPHRPVGFERPGGPHRDVCGRLCGHGPGRENHRPAKVH